MSAFEDAFVIYGSIAAAAARSDALEVGDGDTVDIPHAEKLNALLIKGKGGKRFRIVGVQVVREK